MVYHNHRGDPLMVLGLPSPVDDRDDMMLVEEGANFDRKLLVYPRAAWLPILSLLRRLQEERGKLPTDRPG